MKSLDQPVPIASFPALLARLAAAAGASIDPSTGEGSRAQGVRGRFTVEVERTDWLSDDVEAYVLRETGDNGADREMAWEAHFHAEAEVVLPGAKLRFEGSGWGASELDRFRVEAEAELAARMEQVIRAAV